MPKLGATRANRPVSFANEKRSTVEVVGAGAGAVVVVGAAAGCSSSGSSRTRFAGCSSMVDGTGEQAVVLYPALFGALQRISELGPLPPRAIRRRSSTILSLGVASSSTCSTYKTSLAPQLFSLSLLINYLPSCLPFSSLVRPLFPPAIWLAAGPRRPALSLAHTTHSLLQVPAVSSPLTSSLPSSKTVGPSKEQFVPLPKLNTSSTGTQRAAASVSSKSRTLSRVKAWPRLCKELMP